MVFQVRCFKCGEHKVRLVLGGRSIMHARCYGCDSNLLAEIMAFEEEAREEMIDESHQADDPEDSSHP